MASIEELPVSTLLSTTMNKSNTTSSDYGNGCNGESVEVVAQVDDKETTCLLKLELPEISSPCLIPTTTNMPTTTVTVTTDANSDSSLTPIGSTTNCTTTIVNGGDHIPNGLHSTLSLEEVNSNMNGTNIVMEPNSGSSRSSSLAGTMFTDIFMESKGTDLHSGSLEDSCSSLISEGSNERPCKVCNSRLTNPRVLSCLHVFCKSCLQTLITDENGFIKSSTNNSFALNQRKSACIECPTCKQVTVVGSMGVESLTQDYIQTNILDLSTIESEELSCTSCKTTEKAISRCSDCANFLCYGCDNAHKYMRCFENHEVLKLEDMQKAAADKPVTIHKPLFCNVHIAENLKYYCFNCQIPVCNDCLIADHKGSEHHYDVISHAETLVRGDIEGLMKEAKSKVQYCETAASNLTSALNELQTQHDAAKDVIEETYQTYKKYLEKCRDNALINLEKLHSERELKIMDLLQNIENTMRRIEDVCQFTTRVLEKSNAVEFLAMKKLISAQFIKMINNTPKCDISYSLSFDTKADKFEQLVQDAFGKFRTESTPPSPKESTPPPTLPGLPPLMSRRSCMNSTTNSQGQLTGSVTASSPISLPTSMQSSFDGDMSVLGNGFIMPNMLPPESPQQQHQQHSKLHPLQVQTQQPQQSQPHPHQQQAQHTDIRVFNNGIKSRNEDNLISAVGGGGGENNLNDLIASAAINGSVNSGLTNLQGQLTQGLNGQLSNGYNGSVNAINGAELSVGVDVGTNGVNPGVPPAYNSILEYNLSCLASLSESSSDALAETLSTANSVTSQPSVVTQPITLADILSGDQRAFSNLQALAKLGLNNNEFCMPTATSPISVPTMPLSVGTEDINHVFHVNSIPNTNNTVLGRNKATPMQIRCKFGSLGTSKGQFNSPHGFCLGVDEEIIVADTNNHRIEIFDKTGTLKFQFGVPGKEEGQLWYPRKVAVMHTNGKFVVCDRGNERSRMQIFSKCGHFMRKIAIRYIDIVAGLAVTSKGHIVAVDSVSPTVFVISEDGELVRWFDCSDYMREPSDIAIRDNDFYVCDFKGHCVAVFQEDGTFQYRIGNEKVTCFPNGIDISNAGDILIGDSHGNRFHVACYSRDGILHSEFECPHVKVSRCCGLKITSEGYIVTLAKNNHHVLVLNTLYVH